MANFFVVDTTFNEKENNPFSKDGMYNKNWVMVKLVKDKNNHNISGNFGGNLFTIHLSKCFDGWQFALMDFIQYQRKYNHKNVILSIEKEDYNVAKKDYKGHCNTDKKLRFYEPEVLVHSTTSKSWDKIKECGILKSWNIAKKEGYISETKPIGYLLGDPIEYSDYIMLGGLGYYNELVVASKQKGELCYDENEPYTPSARVYLNADKMARDVLLIRDGMHLKVKDILEIEPYILWVAIPDKLVNHDGDWTPFAFSQMADKMFLQQIINY